MIRAANGNPIVMYKGEYVEVSEKEHHVLYLRGHLTPFYKHADLMESDPCIELRKSDVLPVQQEKGGDVHDT